MSVSHTHIDVDILSLMHTNKVRHFQLICAVVHVALHSGAGNREQGIMLGLR